MANATDEEIAAKTGLSIPAIHAIVEEYCVKLSCSAADLPMVLIALIEQRNLIPPSMSAASSRAFLSHFLLSKTTR